MTNSTSKSYYYIDASVSYYVFVITTVEWLKNLIRDSFIHKNFPLSYEKLFKWNVNKFVHEIQFFEILIKGCIKTI